MGSSGGERWACCILLLYPPPNCLVFMVGGVVCVGNMLLHIYTPKTRIHTKRFRHPRGSHLGLQEVCGRLLRAVM